MPSFSKIALSFAVVLCAATLMQSADAAGLRRHRAKEAALLEAPEDPGFEVCEAYRIMGDMSSYNDCLMGIARGSAAAELLEVSTPASKSGEATTAAIEAAKKAVEYLKDMTTGLVADAEKVEKQIKDWGVKLEGVTDDELAKFLTSMEQAGVLLTNSRIEGNAVMSSLLRMTKLTEKQITSAAGDDAKLKVAIKNAQIIFGAALTSAATKLKGVQAKVQQAQTAYVGVQGQSQLLATKVQDTIDNKNGALDAAKDALRKAAYVGCVASVVFPPAVPACYAAAVITVEAVKIPQMERDLKESESKLTNIKGQFDTLTTKTGEVIKSATTQYTQLANVRSQVKDTKNLVVASSDVDYWTAVMPGQFDSLADLLTKTLADENH